MTTKLNIFLLAAISALLTGCITGNLSKIDSNKTQMWYGRVNTWAASKKNIDKDIKALYNEDVDGYMIEMAGWARSDMWTASWLKETDEMYKYLLNRCRKYNKWLFVSIVNDNMGSKKYGDQGIPLSKVMPQAQQLCQIVKKYGNKNVIVQPVAETQTSAGKQFEQYCLQQLGGFIMVYNGGSRPSGIPAGYQYRAWHPFNVSDRPPRDTIVVSDTGPIILQLGAGYEGPAHPNTLEQWARNMKNIGVPVVGYYAFKFNGHDKAAIKALGRAKKR